MPLLLKNPRVQLILLLFVLFVITMFHLPVMTSLILLIASVGFTAGFDFLFAKIKKQELRIPYSGIITGLILALIIDPGVIWYQLILITAVAAGLKDFLRPGDRHIFNPAASGLMAGFLLFGLNPSWWGPTPYSLDKLHPFNLILALSVVSLGYISLWRYKRYFTVLSYLLVSVALQILLLWATPANALAAMINPGSLFFALVMLPEPMTTPSKKLRQILFGLFVAVINIGTIFALANGVFGEVSNFPDTSLIALLLANLLFFKFR